MIFSCFSKWFGFPYFIFCTQLFPILIFVFVVAAPPLGWSICGVWFYDLSQPSSFFPLRHTHSPYLK